MRLLGEVISSPFLTAQVENVAQVTLASISTLAQKRAKATCFVRHLMHDARL